MIDRKRIPTVDQPVHDQLVVSPDTFREQCRKALIVDRDELDDAVIGQPELYYHVAEQHVLACGRRDKLKLDLEEAEANADKMLRLQAAKMETKVTEAHLRQAIALQPEVANLQRGYTEARTEADLWDALRDAYQQRGRLLPSLVQMHLSRLRTTSMGEHTLTELSEGHREVLSRRR